MGIMKRMDFNAVATNISLKLWENFSLICSITCPLDFLQTYAFEGNTMLDC